jgi:hypothetical protein
MTPFQRGMQIGREFNLTSALRKKFGTPARMAAYLGVALDDIASPHEEEFEMPQTYRRPGDTSRIRSLSADRRRLRAQDANEDPVEYVAALMSEMSPEELGELKEMIGSGDRRRASDEPPPFPGMPRPGGSMVGSEEGDPLARWRQPGEDRRHAADRRRLAHDQMSNSHAAQDAKVDFERRFPSAGKIRLMG